MEVKRIKFQKKPSVGDVIKVYLGKSAVAYGIVMDVQMTTEIRTNKRHKQTKFLIEKAVLKETTTEYQLSDCSFCLESNRVMFVE